MAKAKKKNEELLPAQKILDAVERETSEGRNVGKKRTPEEVLTDEVMGFVGDPLGYVMFMFPWDSEKSIQVVELPEKYRERFPGCKYGPDLWACEFLDELGLEIRKRKFNGKDPVEPIRFATVSGHEIGKSTLVAWLTKFILDTRPHSKGSLTAVTDEQLRTKTWAEVGKWHNMSLTSHWFRYSSSRGNMSLIHAQYSGWRADARTSREESSESFAGQHAPVATSFYIFDEASGIGSKIFEVREGGLTSGEPMVFDFGNGTRNSGNFFEECAGKLRHRYIVRSIDSRTVQITNKKKIAQDAEDYGEDSDFFKVRWKGEFPDRGFAQFIATEDVERCMGMDGFEDRTSSLTIGVDVARFGTNDSVIWPVLGRNARMFEPEAYNGLDTVQLTGKVIERFRSFETLGRRPDMIFVDGGGIGGAVVDQLRSAGYPVTEVLFGSKPSNPKRYRMKSDEMWGRLREAVSKGLALPSRSSKYGDRIYADLTQREYGFMIGEQVIHLESKDDMAKRGLQSPDFGDALALNFAEYIAPQNINASGVSIKQNEDYDPYARFNQEHSTGR